MRHSAAWLLLLVLAAGVAVTLRPVAGVLAVAAPASLGIAGVLRDTPLGWAYWAALACAAGIVTVLVPNSMFRRSADPTRVS